MSQLIINFFGEFFDIDKPKNLNTLRKQISKIFFLCPLDAEAILLTYKEKNNKIIVLNEQDLIKFLNSNNNIIDIDINQNSQLYKKNLNKLKEERNKDKATLEELFQKKEELRKLRETKFDKEKKELKELEEKIIKLSKRKIKIKKIINEEKKQIDKKIREIDEKIDKKLKNIPIQNLKTKKKILIKII